MIPSALSSRWPLSSPILRVPATDDRVIAAPAFVVRQSGEISSRNQYERLFLVHVSVGAFVSTTGALLMSTTLLLVPQTNLRASRKQVQPSVDAFVHQLIK